jgi:SH3/ankyrin repeat-containing protein
VRDVCQWLEAIGLEEHVTSFEENEMMGEHLVDITKEDLKELGVKKLGHQKTFLSKLGQFSK